jgi:hypothetical protein
MTDPKIAAADVRRGTTEHEAEFRFSDTAARIAIGAGLDLADVLAALRGGHFKQPDYEVGKFMHFVKLGGGPAKVVTVGGRCWTPTSSSGSSCSTETGHEQGEEGHALGGFPWTPRLRRRPPCCLRGQPVTEGLPSPRPAEPCAVSGRPTGPRDKLASMSEDNATPAPEEQRGLATDLAVHAVEDSVSG